MTAEQLEAARAERLRHNGISTLTLEEARTWLEETGLCLFLPRAAQLPAIAPSFAEAVEGHRNAAPGPETLATARSLLTRLVNDGVAVPLNLLNTLGEEPDFVVAAWVLPYVFALRGERDWRRPPTTSGSRKVSHLAVEIVRQLEASGPMTTAKLKQQLGREVTEAATLRALDELWGELRLIPIPALEPGAACHWHLLKTRFMKSMQEGASTSQVTAISVLASIYLPAVIAASGEEVEIFLSPMTSRSKIREVMRGLTATRQVNTVAVGAQSFYFVAGTLPEFPTVPSYAQNYSLASLSAEAEHEHSLHGTPRIYTPDPGLPGRNLPGGARPLNTTAHIPLHAPARDAAVTGNPSANAGSNERPGGWTLPRRSPAPTVQPPSAQATEQAVKPAEHRAEAPKPIRAYPGGPRLDRPETGNGRAARASEHRADRRPDRGARRPGAHAGSRPVGTRSGGARSGGARPAGTRSGGPARPAASRSGVSQSGAARPSASRSGASRPGAARSGTARPGSFSSRPSPERRTRPAAAGSRPGTRPAAHSGTHPGTHSGADRPARPTTGTRPAGRPEGFRKSSAARPKPTSTNGLAHKAVRPDSRPNGSRPARPAAASGARPSFRPGGARPDSRSASRPAARPGTRTDSRPGSRPAAARSNSGARPAGPARRSGPARPGANQKSFAGGRKRS